MAGAWLRVNRKHPAFFSFFVGVRLRFGTVEREPRPPSLAVVTDDGETTMHHYRSSAELAMVASAHPHCHCLARRAHTVEGSTLVLLAPSEARRQRRSGRRSLSPPLSNWLVGPGCPSGLVTATRGRSGCTQRFQQRVFKRDLKNDFPKNVKMLVKFVSCDILLQIW
jgi:hypothetical protein